MITDLSQLAASRSPPKLARFELSSTCDLQCKFCCWQRTVLISPKQRLSPEQMSFLCSALCSSNCHNFNITGGEPLKLPLDYLSSSIQAFRAVPGVRQLWITTNGQRLHDPQVPRTLLAAGLCDLAVSIGAHTDESYRHYTNGAMELKTLLKGLRQATELGLKIRVHVPLNPVGVRSAKDLLELVAQVRQAGVRELFYFGLNSGGTIERKFPELYADPHGVTKALLKNKTWKLEAEPGKRPFFTNGDFKICFPRPAITLATDNCRSRDCGANCQGIYAVYVVLTKQGWAFRACHRQFDDNNNVFPIESKWLLGEDHVKLASLLKKVWGYAYGE